MGHAHHPIYDVSIPHFVELVARNVAKMREKGMGKIDLVGRETLFGVATAKIEVLAPATGTSPTLKQGQTLWDLADASGQSMYVILHANERRGWSEPDKPAAGDAVIIPDFYAGRMTLWIDEKLNLPVQADLYDHDGRLYEPLRASRSEGRRAAHRRRLRPEEQGLRLFERCQAPFS
jgi:hypothetical protein